MNTLVFVVSEPRRPDLVVEVRELRILFGSGAHCDIRLPLESAAWEHVVVTQENGRIVARVIPDDTVAFFDGESRREKDLVAGTSIRVDAVTIVLREVTASAVAKSGANPVRTATLAGTGMVLALAMLIFKNASSGATPPPPTAPDPASEATLECPEKQGALPLAHQKLTLARSKRDRFRFYPHDGVDAVKHFKTAASCFRSANDAEGATTADAEGAALQASVRDEFHTSRVKLERALLRRDARTALAQVKFQRELLAGAPNADAYVTWLALLQSRLELLVAQETS